jgi:hypothetical protein
MSSLVSGTRSSQVQHIAEDFGPSMIRISPELIPSLRASCHCCYLHFRSLCLQVTETRGRLPSRRQSGLGPHC